MKAGLYTYAWDLEAIGYNTAVGQIAEAGFTAVNLATAYHAGKFILPRNPQRKVYFSEDGSLYFMPDLSRYGKIKPRVNSMVSAEGDPVGRLSAAASKYGLEYVAWTVCLHNTWIGERHPDVTMHNAFGDPQLHSLSPAHPDVRAYLVALVGDLVRRYDVSAIELESPGYMGFAHGFHHEIYGVKLDAVQQRLLGISFNPVEIAGATAEGIDAANLRLRVASLIDDSWNRGRPVEIDGAPSQPVQDLLADEEFIAYEAWLNRQVVSLAEEVRAAIRAASSSTRIRHFAAMAAGEQPDVQDPLLATGDDILLGYAATPADAEAKVAAFAGAEKPLWGMLRSIAPDFPEPEGLEEIISNWKRSGVEGLDIYNFGLMSQPNFDAVARALNG